MLSPKRTKYRKYQKGRIRGTVTNGTSSGKNVVIGDLMFGQYGIKALTSGRLSASVLEAARRTMTRQCRRRGQLWIRVFPDIPFTAKPVEVRMGKGKGSLSFWASRVKKGQILFELDGISKRIARQAVYKAIQKLSITAKFVEL